MVVAQYEEVLTRISRRTLDSFPELRKALRGVLGVDADSVEINVPAVVALVAHVPFVKSGVKYSKLGLAQRDHYTCQYCGKLLAFSAITKDHVIPRDMGGTSCWENVVVACQPCNAKKGNKLPAQVGMHLLKKPCRPKYLPNNGLVVEYDSAPPEWQPFLIANQVA